MPRPKRFNRNDITPEVLRTFSGFENTTDEEAEWICSFTIQICHMAYEAHLNNKSTAKLEEDERLKDKVPEIRKAGC